MSRLGRELQRLGSRLHGGFLWLAIVALAFGLGTSTAAFNLLDAMLLRPLPVEDPGALVALYRTGEDRAAFGPYSYPDYLDFKRSAESLQDLAAYAHRPLVLTHSGMAERTWAGEVSVNYFDLLGVEPQRGRLFLPEDEKAGSLTAVVLSHRYWRQTLQGAADVLGRELTLNDGVRAVVVGIAPPGFRGTVFDHALDLWLPIREDDERRNRRDVQWLDTLIGRLAPGTGLRAAEPELRSIAAALAADHPTIHGDHGIHAVPLRLIAPPRSRRQAFALYGVLFLTSLLVLAAAVNNLTSLLVARAFARRRETSVRQAIGASRWRAARPFLLQGGLIALLAGAGGLLFAHLTRQRIRALLPEWRAPLNLDLSAGVRSLTFLILVVALVALGIGLGPALVAARRRFRESLQEATGGSAGRAMTRLRRLLIASQIPLALVLLVISGLMLRSLHAASTVKLGFDGDDVRVVPLETELQELPEARTAQLYRRLLAAAGGVPGVTTAALAQGHPFGFNWTSRRVLIPGAGGEPRGTLLNVVSPEFFAALDIPLVQGRLFRATDDAEHGLVGIVNTVLADEAWPDGSPVGRTLLLGGPGGEPVRVIGVAGAARYRRLTLEPAPILYLSARQRTVPNMSLLVEVDGAAAGVLERLRPALRRSAPEVPLQDVRSLTSFTYFSVWQQRMVGFFSSILALVTLVLGCLGVYGIIDYFTRRRSKEIAVRMALGSGRRQVAALVLRQGLLSVAAGLLVGLLAAAAVSRWLLGRLLFEVGSFDPLIFSVAPALLLLVSAAAIWVPATRAARSRPAEGLRQAE